MRQGRGPEVVLLHAGVADRSMWSEQLEGLAASGYRVVAPDPPGFGSAPIGDEPWCDVLATMDAHGIERAWLVGNSWGAAVALRAAVVAPGRVASLDMPALLLVGEHEMSDFLAMGERLKGALAG